MIVREFLLYRLWTIVSAVAFVASSMVFFNDRHKRNIVLVSAAGVLAIASSITLVFDYKDMLWTPWSGKKDTENPFKKVFDPESGPNVVQDNIQETKLGEDHVPGKVFSDCDECPKMVVIPAGKSTIGAKVVADHDRMFDNHSLAPVEIDLRYGISISRAEITVAEWSKCVSENVCEKPLQSYFTGFRPEIVLTDTYPAIVSWDEANTYADWITRKAGKRYRLPSESEWEFGARGGTSTAFWFGNALDSNLVNVELFGTDEEWSYSYNTSHRIIRRVGLYAPNPFGLYDVIGNAPEWVEDCFVIFKSTHERLSDGEARIAEFPRNGTPYKDVDKCRLWAKYNGGDGKKERHVIKGGGTYAYYLGSRKANTMSFWALPTSYYRGYKDNTFDGKAGFRLVRQM